MIRFMFMALLLSACTASTYPKDIRQAKKACSKYGGWSEIVFEYVSSTKHARCHNGENIGLGD